MERMRATITERVRAARERLGRLNAHNLSTLQRSPLSELSGSLGDLGTFLPFLIALTRTGSISLPTTLVFTGLANIFTGMFFGIPLPVQPMKAIGAIAIARWLSEAETASAGLFVGALVFIFSVTGLLTWFARVIPIPVVKGIQVGTGISLLLSAGKSLEPYDFWPPGGNLGDRVLYVVLSLLSNGFFVLFLAFFLLMPVHRPRFPYAAVIFVVGVIGPILDVIYLKRSSFQFWQPHALLPSPREFGIGIPIGLGQLPLTTLNSIIAVAHLSNDLFPALPDLDINSLGLSVALMNLIGCWFGSMPVCHGSGGLAAQYRFGARSGASIIFLGSIKLLLGLFCGSYLFDILEYYPKPILALLVIAAGLELAKVGESLNHGALDLRIEAEHSSESADHEGAQNHQKKWREPDEEERKQRWAVMLITLGFLLAFKNDAIGFLAGMLCHWNFLVPGWWADWRSGRGGRGPIALDEERSASTGEAEGTMGASSSDPRNERG
ncbi:MAG: hypothetical protein M1812_006934 [Candelaria pacifica]|nr:MAG: hypothetical protein M1812_006934 [Candelaria pacifica]